MKKIEFSKILAAWAAFTATAVIVSSVMLAAYDKQTISEVSIAVFTACIGYLITYAGKSAFEKNSRNKYYLDADGEPIFKTIAEELPAENLSMEEESDTV